MKSILKRVLSLAIALIMLSALLCGCTDKKDKGNINISSLQEKNTILYTGAFEKPIPLAFSEKAEGLAMISLELAASILQEYVRAEKDQGYTLEVKTQGERVTLVRDNKAESVIDFKNGTVYFEDYNRFNTLSYELGALDVMDSDGLDEEGQPEYFKRVLHSEEKGNSSFIDLKERGIPYLMQKGKGYIAMQTFSDIYLAPYEIMLSYNGKDAFILDRELIEISQELYYKSAPDMISPQLIDFNYRELCLMLDLHYGLAQEHGITTADSYISRIGLKEGFYSEDPNARFSALKTLIYRYLSDNHSNVLMHSPYNSQAEYSLGAEDASIGYWEFYKNYQAYNSYRAEQFKEEAYRYKEIGDTAFVCFDTFLGPTADYYESKPDKNGLNDEIALISYAHSRITRKDSPIKNVVIDLATNTGGHMDGGIYLASWVLGNAVMHITDPVRGAHGSYIYRADVNLDREFDENDCISDKQIYLITSPITFSCANYVANAMQESGRVTLLGSTTGGGAACVYTASLADGAAVTLSSSLCISGYKNGSYYSIDRGIAPDIKIENIKDIFDYTKLKKLINNTRE